MEVISGQLNTAQKVVIYGPEGIGKTLLASQFPRTIFIDTEGSTNQMNVNRLKKPSSWEMLHQQVQWVKQQGDRFGTLVIDTTDWAEMLCINSVCAMHGKSGIESFGWGHGYTYTAEEFGRLLNLLTDVVDSGIHVVLVAHSQIVKFDQPDEMGSYDRYQLKLGKKTAPLVKEWADMVLFINYKTFSVAADKDGKKHKAQGGVRTVYATHHPAWDAKNRHGLPDEFPLDFNYLAHIFNKESTSLPVIRPEQQAPQQQAQQQPAPTPPPEQPASQSPPPAQPQGNLSPNIPASLRDLMTQHQVTEIEIQTVVGVKGYYPAHTPITNYDPQFIDGVLVGAWNKVFEMIKDARKNMPF